jgi:uncharacterized protein (DUF1684 family)
MTTGPVGGEPSAAQDALDLVDYRRQVWELYRAVRAAEPGEATWRDWRRGRDELLRGHPQTPVAPADRAAFTGMGFFGYDPAWRLEAVLEPRAGRTVEGWEPVGSVAVAGAELTVFRLTTYGGGLFLPFRDATNGRETYGGGRYVLDTVKGADLGTTPSGALVLDFNYAYHPSCAHDPVWTCPLPPPENRVPGAVRVGEILSDSER